MLRVLRAMQEPRLTQHKMARRAGMNISRYWQIENGEGLPPSEDERLAIAEELGVRPSEIAWPTDVRQAVNG